MTNIIADRYEILELIGQGGMADVYLAKDTILNRVIAIKILRTSLAKDPIYITRFQREASAAAALSHKNIVEIYDVGEDGDKYYIVMEYVPGTTLKELVHKRGALHVVEAVDVMKQVVSGASKAHQLGITHRDLKPQNILVTDSGVAKIADFGIASMQSLAQVTQTDVIMGSLHYLAPELARGEKATSQSDIYALGIVFYELLRGEVPFNGESPVNIALKHMQEEIPSVRDFNPSIPQSVENVIIKATAKNLKDRYQNATEMLQDISTCMDRLDEEKLVFTYNQNTDPTIVVDPRSVFSGDTTVMNASKKTVSRTEKETEEKPKKGNGLLDTLKNINPKVWIGVATGAFLVIAAIVYFAFFSGGGSSNSSMPDLIGMKQDEAKVLLEKYEVTIDENVTEELSDEYDAGLIIDTNPKPEKTIKKGDVVKITVSKGKYIVMDDYSGQSYDKAKEALEKLGFVVNKEEETSSQNKGTVISQSITKNTKVDPTEENKEITLTVSKGQSITVSNYVGMTYDKAYGELTKLGFTVTKQESESEQAVGTVIGQSRDANSTLDPDTNLTITLTVSKGISIEVPNVKGYEYREAESILRNKGFTVKGVDLGTTSDEDAVGKVIEQSPEAFSTVDKKGVTVTIKYYSKVASNNSNSNSNSNTNTGGNTNGNTNSGGNE